MALPGRVFVAAYLRDGKVVFRTKVYGGFGPRGDGGAAAETS